MFENIFIDTGNIQKYFTESCSHSSNEACPRFDEQIQEQITLYEMGYFVNPNGASLVVPH